MRNEQWKKDSLQKLKDIGVVIEFDDGSLEYIAKVLTTAVTVNQLTAK